MSLQYLTNANPPPKQSALQYDVEPGTVFISNGNQQLYANFSITVTNTGGETVNCIEFQFGFLAGAAGGNLTSASDAGVVTPASDQNEWGIVNSGFVNNSNPHLYLFTAAPSGIDNYLPLAAGASLVFHLPDVVIDESVGEGTAPFTIIEQTGTGRRNKQTVQGTLDITKQTSSLSTTSFVADPPTPINPGTPIELSWKVAGSDHWQLYDATTATLLYDSNTGTPKNLTEWPISPQQLKPQKNTTYQLVAWAGQLYTVAPPVDVTVMAAEFTQQATANPSTVNAPGDQSMLHWETQWASQLVISAPNFKTVTLDAPSGQYDTFPKAPGNLYAVNPDANTNYTLQIFGPSNSHDTQQVSVSVESPPPLITLAASSSFADPGQSTSLSWQTSYADGGVYLSQRSPGQAPTQRILVQNSASDYPVQPSGIVTYILTAFGAGGTTSAEVMIVERAGHISANQPFIWTFDGSYIWLVYQPDGPVLATLRASDLNFQQFQEGGYSCVTFAHGWMWALALFPGYDNELNGWTGSGGSYAGSTSTAPFKATSLVSDGTYLWAADDNEMIRLDWGLPYGDAIPVGCGPSGLVFDGENMWAYQTGSGVVTKIRASDATIVGHYTVGTNLSAIFFDGTYIRVADADSKSVMRIRIGDGGIEGTPVKTGAVVTQFAFDGETLWMANNANSQVLGLRASDESIVTAISINDEPGGTTITILYDGTYLWVADNQTVMKLKLKTSSAEDVFDESEC
jgi:hypothetical protein